MVMPTLCGNGVKLDRLLANGRCYVSGAEAIENNFKEDISMDNFDELREKILPVLLPYGVKRIAIFGSVVRGEETSDSDIDILVELKPPNERSPIGLRWFSLEEELEQILECKVDLVSQAALSPYIKPYVEKEMILLYEE